MKRIGYIFKYSDQEQKGILVYGHWKRDTGLSLVIKDKPVKFSLGDCKTAVKTGHLVFFELTETGVTSIERASLANFDESIICEITTEKERDYSDWYYTNTHITFEYLGDLDLQPADKLKKEKKESEEYSISGRTSLFDDIFEEYDYEYDFFDESDYFTFSNPACGILEIPNLPESIDELFEYFGKYRHRLSYKANSASVCILDISLWIDKDVMRDSFYGSTVKQFLNLCSIFIDRKRINHSGNTYVPRKDNNYISDSWKYILSKFKDDEIREIISKYPILQPLLPKRVCIENLDALSEEYGMPDVSICKAYNEYQITKADSASDYNHLLQKFNIYANCDDTNLKGVPMCKMGKEYIKHLMLKLEYRYKEVIAANIKNKFEEITGYPFTLIYYDGSEQQIQKVLIKVGTFIEAYEDVMHNCFSSEITKEASIFDKLNDLPKEIQDVLKIPTKNHINKTILEFARRNETLPSDLNHRLYYLDSWIDESTKKELCNIINLRFPVFYSLTELWEAYDCNLITGLQYRKEFRNLTQNFSIYELIRELKECRWGHFHETFVVLPLSVQWYIVSRIIEMFDFKSLDSFNYVKIDEYGTAISNIKTLLKWIRELSGLDKRLFNRVERKITSVLTEEENWTLFKEELISSPGMNNIRNCLNKLYKKKSRNFRFYIHDSFPYTMYYEFEKAGDKYLTKDCFQDVMYNDFLKTNDSSLKILIADYLTSERQIELQRKCKGVLNLYMWIKNPDKHYDWNLITTYFAELPDEQQIRLLKYVFYLLANNQITYSIAELYSLLLQSSTKISPAITGILYLIKEKLSHPRKSLNIESFKNEILEDAILSESFELIKDFFYPCNGHIALTYMKRNLEYHTYNGYITKTEVQGKEYYSIHFYDVPHDVCNREVEWLDDKDIQKAKIILETNIKTKIVGDNYLVDISNEVAVKTFVMAFNIDDHCCILDSKQAMIEKGYLPSNNAYQPLYTNCIRLYDDDCFDVCRCTDCIEIDPIDGIPFYWCNKKPCVRRCHYILPISEWEKYKLPNMLYILLGATSGSLSKVWKITAEISQFINTLFEYKRSISCDEPKLVIKNSPIKNSDEIGVLTDDLSIVQNICDADEYDEYDEREYVDSSYEVPEDTPTYERYAGTYAQDVAGYSDDDIDTIFDGDPDAYWNID